MPSSHHFGFPNHDYYVVEDATTPLGRNRRVNNVTGVFVNLVKVHFSPLGIVDALVLTGMAYGLDTAGLDYERLVLGVLLFEHLDARGFDGAMRFAAFTFVPTPQDHSNIFYYLVYILGISCDRATGEVQLSPR